MGLSDCGTIQTWSLGVPIGTFTVYSVNIDYVGKVNKKEFEGGADNSYQLEFGSKNFIDNFEEQLVNKKSGDKVVVKVKFPKNYHTVELSGETAEFGVVINDVLTAEMSEITDDFIKNNFGLDNIEKLTETVKNQVESNYDDMSRSLFKKEVFEFLNKKYDFKFPSDLVDEQLNSVWSEIEELKTNPNKFKNDKEKEKAKEKKRDLEESMVRCGIIVSVTKLGG
jgi:trigger factor